MMIKNKKIINVESGLLMIMNIEKMKMEQILNKFYVNRIVGEFFGSLNLENTSSLKDLLETKSNIVYKKFSGVINPPILDRWNWLVVIPQQFNRYAYPCNLLTVLVPPISIIKNYLLLIKNNINKSQIIKKEKYEHQDS